MISRKALDHTYIMYLSVIDRMIADGMKIVVAKSEYLPDMGGEEVCGHTRTDDTNEHTWDIHIAGADRVNQVSTLLHEVSHKIYPDQDESFIKQLEEELVTSFSTDQLKHFEQYLK